MQVLVIISSNADGGVATYQSQKIRKALSDGFRIFLLDDAPHRTLAKLEHTLRKQVHVYECPVWERPNLVQIILKKIINEEDKIIFSISNPSLLIKYAPFFIFFKRLGRVRLQLTLHSRMIFSRHIPSYVGEFLASIICYFLSCSVIYVSDYTKRYWQARHPFIRACKNKVERNTIQSISHVSPRSLHCPVRVGFVGRLSSDKDPLFFCRVADYALQRSDKFVFYIFGIGVLQTILAEKFASQVEFYGWQNDEFIYTNIDILLITSPIENSPYALLEAKSWGIPVVAGKVGGIPEILKDGVEGILFNSFKPEVVVKALDGVVDQYPWFSENCLMNRSC